MENHSRRFDKATRDVPRRKASINELSEDEIVFAYRNLQAEREPIGCRNEDLSTEMQKEFLRWMEMKRKDERKSNATVTSNSEKSTEAEKVNQIDDSEIASEFVDVVKREHEQQTVDDEASETPSDFDDFQDVISDNEEERDEEYLNIPLVILEDGDDKPEQLVVVDEIESCKSGEETNEKEEAPCDAFDSSQNTVEAKITLSNAPLKVVTNLSTSSISLASDKSYDEAGCSKHRPAKHTKGRAPLPPTNVMSGHYYDNVTKKFFKETEL